MVLSRPIALLAIGLVGLSAGIVRFCSLRALRRKFGDPLPAAFPYRARASLVTKNEMLFYTALRRAAGARFTIAPKVRLADVITCRRAAWSMGYGRLIAQKHIDFLVCDPAGLRVLLAVEVDDHSHERRDRQRRDRFVDRALRAAGVPLVRVRAAASYDHRDLEDILSTLHSLTREATLPWRERVVK
jgi:very-short-patch-repair endonuclease